VATIEYALILSTIAVFGISAIQHLGAGLNRSFNRLTAELENGASSVSPDTSGPSGGSVYRPTALEELGGGTEDDLSDGSSSGGGSSGGDTSGNSSGDTSGGSSTPVLAENARRTRSFFVSGA